MRNRKENDGEMTKERKNDNIKQNGEKPAFSS